MTDQDVVTEIWQVISNHEYIWGKKSTGKNLGKKIEINFIVYSTGMFFLI